MSRLADEAMYFGAVADGVESQQEEIAALRQQVTLLREALRFMHDEKCDYMRLNKLGDPLRETSARLALKALAATEPRRRNADDMGNPPANAAEKEAGK